VGVLRKNTKFQNKTRSLAISVGSKQRVSWKCFQSFWRNIFTVSALCTNDA